MIDCWQQRPEDRPEFSFITQFFKSLLQTLDVDVDVRSDDNDDTCCKTHCLLGKILKAKCDNKPWCFSKNTKNTHSRQ